jgi:HEAT repeat protein
MGDHRGVAALLGALLHIHPYVRRQAALALGDLEAYDAASALIEMLRYEMDPTAKYGGIVALGRLKSSQALGELEALSKSKEKTSYGESIGSAASEAQNLIRKGF